jgi:hypothetical protein
MTKTYTPDERPALAFDERKEVQAILDALNAYRYNHIDQKDVKLDEYILNHRHLIHLKENAM